MENGAGEREGSGSWLPPTVESESRVEEKVVVEVELVLVLVLEASRWILLLEKALCLTLGGDGERVSLRLSFSLRERSRRDEGVEVVVAS